jgi:hypothetical protein
LNFGIKIGKDNLETTTHFPEFTLTESEMNLLRKVRNSMIFICLTPNPKGEQWIKPISF